MIQAKVKLTFPTALQFVAETGSGHRLIIDDAIGHTGPKPIELMAAALAGCTAFDVATILRSKKHKNVTAYEVSVEAEQRHEPPQVFTTVIGLIGSAGLLLAVLHGIEAALWAAAYWWLGALNSAAQALLYSVDSISTRGASGPNSRTPLADDGRVGGDGRHAAVRHQHGVHLHGDARLLATADPSTPSLILDPPPACTRLPKRHGDTSRCRASHKMVTRCSLTRWVSRPSIVPMNVAFKGGEDGRYADKPRGIIVFVVEGRRSRHHGGGFRRAHSAHGEGLPERSADPG